MISNMHGRNFVGSGFLWRFGLAGSILILLLAGSVGQASSAGAQQDKPAFTIYSRELQKKGYVCVGEKIHIIVRVLTAHKPKPNQIVLDYVSGDFVTALVTGGTGTVTPDKAGLGFDSTVPEGAEFVFEAKKAGKEKIFFEALITSVLFLSSDIYIEHPLEFQVKKCKYKANLILEGQLSDEGVAWSGIGLLEDAIIEQGEDGVYRGSADFEFNVFNHATTDGGCVYQPHTAISQAEITGQPNEDVMTWTLTYQDAQELVTATCVDVGTQTFDNLQPLSEYGPAVVTISSSGGAARYKQSWSWPTGGEFATYTIIVEPVEERSVSRTGDPVAWLPDWFEPTLFLP